MWLGFYRSVCWNLSELRCCGCLAKLEMTQSSEWKLQSLLFMQISLSAVNKITEWAEDYVS